MAQLRGRMALIGVLIVGGTGDAWAAEEASGEAPDSGLTRANAAALSPSAARWPPPPGPLCAIGRPRCRVRWWTGKANCC
jgi:hypothetical protein